MFHIISNVQINPEYNRQTTQINTTHDYSEAVLIISPWRLLPKYSLELITAESNSAKIRLELVYNKTSTENGYYLECVDKTECL